ncbi:TSR1 [Candida oxycetoniae]|uniref:TSR1 n=1 Tax=Candida oxycetoniae TaxID=497107 RepID=A0AAI9WW22_9ASCO|nr:TSR1 [Candida oxycetoniae]KAI3402287.2 TSR1 [Candida oxycetoniae]
MARGLNSHRKTLKKDHKPFKSKHATKGQLKNQFKGKVEKKSGTSLGNNVPKPLSKTARKNLARQLKENKILESKLTKKLFEGNSGAQKIITIICLTNDLSPIQIANQLFNQDEDTCTEFQYPGVVNLNVKKMRSNLKVILPNQNNILHILDAAKNSDFVVFGISATKEIEPEHGETILRTLLAQGIGSVIGVLPNLVTAYPKRNLQLDVKQSLQSFFNHFFPAEDKLYSLESASDNANCLRYICQKFPSSVSWRDSRGWVVADKAECRDQYEGIIVEGTCRGTGFNVNRLVHIPGYGDFQVEKIEKLNKLNGKHRNEMQIDEDIEESYEPDESQDTLDELNPEPIEEVVDEEMWDESNPQASSLGVRSEGKIYFNDDDDDKVNSNGTGGKRIPKGTSEYQSRWLVEDVLDEDASDLEVEVNDENEDENAKGGVFDEAIDQNDQLTDDAITEYADSEMHIDLSPEEEERQLEETRQAAKDDLEFPDEIELQPGESAVEKLSSYRGVKSLANCDWKVDEQDAERPSIWNRLLRVSNYKATKNRVNKEFSKTIQIYPGDHIRLYIKAPKFVLENVNVSVKPFCIYELLQHEHKLAVLNFSFESWEEYEKPISNKDTMVVQYGFRRQVINPVFSQASNNKNNVHKQENFHHLGNTTIATAIAPIFFTNAPVIFFKPSGSGNNNLNLELIGKGTYLGCDHTRIVAQRIVLTGHAVKIHKKVVTVRYMFFNPRDVNYFKAVGLFTRSGRSGFIKESLGTHGYFKATFDGRLTSQDVIAMSLYKRTWPEISNLYEE